MPDQLLTDLASLQIPRASDIDPEQRGPIFYAVIALVAAGLLAGGYFVLYPSVEARLFKMEVATTEISLVSPAQSQVELTATGYVVPQLLSKVGSPVTGRVARVLVRQGQRVAAGEPLLRLEEVERRAAIAAANARAQAAQARVQLAEANQAEIQKQAQRARSLAQGNVGTLASAVDLEARVEALGATVKAMHAEVKAAQAETVTLQTGLTQLTIVAPIDGTVLTKPPELGEIVSPQSSLLELADLSQTSLTVEVDVPEARLERVRTGGPCEIVLDAFPSRHLRGQTLEILPRVSRAKATIPIKVGFTDSVERVLPDMAARVNFLRSALSTQALTQAPKVLVPASAIAERGGTKVVFVFDKEQERVQSTPVLLGPPLANGFELVSGPAPGTRVVREPAAKLGDGQRVKEKDRS